MRRHARGRSRDPRKIRLLALAGVVAACAIALPLAVASAGPVESAGAKRTAGSAGAERAAGSVGAGAHTSESGAHSRASESDAHSSASESDAHSSASESDAHSSASESDAHSRASGSGPHAFGSGADSRASGSAAVRPSSRADDKAPESSSGAPGLPALGQGLSTAVRCGPELSSPDGVEAQTCVVTQGAETWARTYYRNTTGEALDAALSLMGPGDRTVRMTCALGAEDEPGTCETPREPARGNPAAYTAVAEFAERGGRGPLLLRSGSN
ncbi:hypothetical protein [Streptomyces sp. NPDC013187]|uniref:hypothetical protein n=1 Tax=Streptomyces sp. NPDC013187 TaxID=3364865 RepID=UPI0036A1DF81